MPMKILGYPDRFKSFLLAMGLILALPAMGAAEVEQDNEVNEAKEVESVVPETVLDLAAIEKRVTEVIKQATPATVSVQSAGGAGSGVIVSKDGYVLTAGHVAMQPNQRVIFVLPDGKKVSGKSLGVNVGIDSGLMKITDPGPWPFVEMGDASSLKPGSWVVAMGHPGGFDVERSVVSRLGRVFRVRDSVIQTDCTIIGGDSGGPLFDLDGKVVGIHSRISTSLRQNFHVPVSEYTNHWDRLSSGEVWNRPLRRNGARPGGPYIGVQGANGFALGKGAVLGRVYPDTPAAKAGLKPNDVIVEFDGDVVGSFGDLATLVGQLEPGDRVPLVVDREGRRVKLSIEIGKAGER